MKHQLLKEKPTVTSRVCRLENDRNWCRWPFKLRSAHVGLCFQQLQGTRP